MKAFALFVFLFSSLALGVTASKKVTASGGSPIPTTYTTGSQSLVLTALPSTIRHVSIFNDTTSRIAVQITHGTSANAPGVDTREIYVPAGFGIVLDEVGASNQIFLRSDAGATITSGSVFLEVW